jgi:proteasome lid subunit RPN8/RPN11
VVTEPDPAPGPVVGTDAYYPGPAGRSHPGPAAVSISVAMRDALLVHAKAAVPNEACGIIVGDRSAADGGTATRWVPLRNPLASPYRYSIDPDDLLRLTVETDDADEVFWAIVHSHVASPAYPSLTDIGLAFYPEALYILVSLQPAAADAVSGEPGVRAWRIVDGAVHEVRILPG